MDDQALSQTQPTTTPAQFEAQKLYDPESGVKEAFRSIWDRIYDRESHSDGTETFHRFRPDDFVRVMNIDDETFYWQALDPRDEDQQRIGNQYLVMQNTVRKDPKIYSCPAGATVVLEGWNAAIFIEKLYKLVVTKTESKRPLLNGQKIRNFGYSNPQRQEEYINKIFVGVERPNFAPVQPTYTAPEAKQSTEPTIADMAKELGIADGDSQNQD